MLRRHKNELKYIYIRESKRNLTNVSKQRLSEKVYVSYISDLSLADYIEARSENCADVHSQPCSNMLKVAHTVLQQVFCTLSEAYAIASPSTKYSAEVARRLLLQMPLVAIRVGNPQSGYSFTLLMELFVGADYVKISEIFLII